MNETFIGFSLSKRIKTTLALLSRSLFYTFQNRTTNFAAKELYFYDLIKKAFSVGLNPRIGVDQNNDTLKLNFESGYLKNKKVNLRNGGSDLQVFSQILLEQEYKPLVKLIKQKNVANIDFIVDAGANIGLTTLYLKQFFPDAKIAAIEPDNGNFALLSKNVEINNLNDVHLLKGGLWHEEASLEIDRSFRDSQEWSITLTENIESKNQSNEIQGFPLSAIKQNLDFPRIDILKIDIEGGERFLFADELKAKQLLDEVRFLALEIHDEFNIRPQIENLLTLNDFSFFEVGETVFAYRN